MAKGKAASQQSEQQQQLVSWTQLPGAHARVRARLATWQALDDAYVSKVVQHGLRLPWVGGFDPLFPSKNFFGPRPTFNMPDLPSQVSLLIKDMVLDGSITEVDPYEIFCQSQIFAIPKKESNQFRLITNLKNINAF